MKKYFILVFIIIGTVFTVGLVSHFILFDISGENIISDDHSNEKFVMNSKTKLPTPKIRPEVYKSEIGEDKRVDAVQNEEPQEHDFENETKNENNEEVVKPWYDDGKPGVSRAELQSIHDYQMDLIEKELNNPDAIVIEATDVQPAVTRAELEALHEKQMQQIQEELNNPDAIVTEATDDQPVVTRGELQALHDEQIQQINEELNDPNSIAIEATDDQSAVTRGELVALHEDQLQQIQQDAKDPNAPAIETEDGTIITNRELEELHAKQRYQILESEFNGDEVVSLGDDGN